MKYGSFALVLAISLFSRQLCAQENPGGTFTKDVLLANAERLFSEGNELLLNEPERAKTLYKESAGYYRALIDEGTVNGGILYNAGNAYFRAKDPGNAILMYRRALLFTPDDSRLRYNLEYARKSLKTAFSPNPGSEVLDIILFLHRALPFPVKVLLFLLLNLLFWGGLSLRLFGRSTVRIALAAGVLCLVVVTSAAADIRTGRMLHGVVTAAETTGRRGDSRSYESSFSEPLSSGVEFTVKERRLGWIFAEFSDGSSSWLEEKDCAFVEEFQYAVCVPGSLSIFYA